MLYSPNRFYLILADFRIKFPWSCCKSLKKIIKNERNDSFVSFIVISLWDWDFCFSSCCCCYCLCWSWLASVFPFSWEWFIFQTLNFIFQLDLIWKDINFFWDMLMSFSFSFSLKDWTKYNFIVGKNSVGIKGFTLNCVTLMNRLDSVALLVSGRSDDSWFFNGWM